MYELRILIRGSTSLLQNRFAPDGLNTLMQGAKKQTGTIDYSQEWVEGMYATSDGYLYQPASHIEAAMVKAAASFKVKGARGKTWKDPIRAYCYVQPEKIIHQRNGDLVYAPDASLLGNPTQHLCVNIQRVRVQRAAVARSRLEIALGWELGFTMEVHDEQVRPDVVYEILAEAGRAVGIGDYRPRYGRFEIIAFDSLNKT